MGLFQPSERARRKLADRAAPLLGPGTVVRRVFIGRAHARFTTTVAIVGGVFVAAFVIALVLGVVLLPGGIALILVVNSVRPQRLVVVADRGVALLARSAFSSRPSTVLAQVSTGEVASALRSSSGAVAIGPDRITFSRKEREQLHLLLSSSNAPSY